MDDYAGEDLLRRQAVVYVDDDGRVADAESFAEVVIFVRDALRELHDVCVVGHWDIDAILAATYEEVALHVGPLRVCGLWRVFSESRKPGRRTKKPAPEACILMKRNSGAEMMVLNAGRFARSGVGHCPETPHNRECGHVPKLPKGYGPELSSHVESGELAEGERPGAHVALQKAHAISYTVQGKTI